MSLADLQFQREKFDDFDLELFNAHHDTLKTQFEADNEPTQERLDAATTARETEAETCRKFRNWCLSMRDRIPRDLDDATKVAETERPQWQKLHTDIAARLPALEAECPIADDPQPPPPGRKAIRTMN